MNPLRFEPHLRPMVWGGQRLNALLNKSLPDEQTYGESWEVSDHSLHASVVAAGPHAGKTLRFLMENQRDELLGPAAEEHSTFPWLIKFLDAHDWLSVQVHPDENAVKKLRPGEGSKTEAWFILHAKPGSRVYAGLLDGVDEQALRAAVEAGTVAECLHQFEPRAGDCVFLPAGTLHAVGGGIVMAEIQQTSDATFRLFDWNRRDAQGNARQLHIDDALASIHWDYGPVEPRRSKKGSGVFSLVKCPYFRMDYVECDEPIVPEEYVLQALVVVRGKGRMHAGTENYELQKGHVWILPAVCPRVEIQPAETLGLVVCRLPNVS